MAEGRYDRLSRYLESRDSPRIKALRVYASTNLEQVAAALRMTVIINVSVPVIFMTVTTQISDGRFWDILWELYAGDPGAITIIIGTLIIALLALLAILIWGTIRLGEARDVRHLIDLYAAERGIFFGLEDTVEMQSG